MNGISIVICCYNSVLNLPDTLNAILKQRVKADFEWEIIIVDNVSKDDTYNFANNFLTTQTQVAKLNYKVLKEMTPGKSYAEFKGVSESIYDLILICDDDNRLNPDYLQLAYEIISGDPKIAALGGKGIAEFESQPPEWFIKDNSGFALGNQGDISGDITFENGFVYGAGMVFRKSIYEELYHKGFYHLLTCRKGDQLSTSGDRELCYAFTMLGYKIWFDERLTFYHFIPNNRCTFEYHLKLAQGLAKSSIYITPYMLRLLHMRKIPFKSYHFKWYYQILSKIKKIFGRDLFTFIRYTFKIVPKSKKQIFNDFYLSGDLALIKELWKQRKLLKEIEINNAFFKWFDLHYNYKDV